MTTHLFKLHFAGGLHIADGGFAEERSGASVRSDTLLSAMAYAARLLYGDAAGARLLEPGAAVVSSAFPFLGERLFFPKPLSAEAPRSLPKEERKQWKKIRYIEKTLLDGYCAGRPPDITLHERVVQSCLLAAPLNENERQSQTGAYLFQEVELPRIAVDRVSMATTLFNVAEVRFADNAGLFFLARFADAETERIARAAVRLLGDEGVGADRTTGKGLFRLEESSFELPRAAGANAWLLLSLYAPATEEECSALAPENSFYGLVSRGGWASGATLRRKTLRMFTEGSVLSFGQGIEPRGSIPVVLDDGDHNLPFSLVRNAQAFALPFSLPITAPAATSYDPITERRNP